MSPERWREAEAIFQETADLEGSARSAFLEKSCGADEELRRAVEDLLKHTWKSHCDYDAISVRRKSAV